MRTALVSLFLAVGSLAVAAEGGKTAEQQFKNIVVFKGVPASQIDATMDVMAAALGVGCEHCHVRAEKRGMPWPMEKDDKQAKRTARKMVKMMQSINKQFFGGDQVVTCATCHHGRAEPLSVPPLERAAGAEAEADEGERKPPSLTVEQLLDKWVQASGGAAAWGKLKTRVAHGTVDRGHGNTMTAETVQAAPDRYHLTATMKQGVFEQGWDGKHGWRKFGGHALPLESTAEVEREAVFALPLGLPKLLTGLKVLPDASVGTRAAHVVEGRQGDERVRLFFDAQTGLLGRMVVRQPTPAGDLVQQLDFDDYRVVDGVKLPFVVKTNSGGGDASTETYTDIKQNVRIDEAQFAPPHAGAAPAR